MVHNTCITTNNDLKVHEMKVFMKAMWKVKSCIRCQTHKQIRIIRIYMYVRWFVIVARTIYEMLMTSTNILKRLRIVISLFCGQKRYPSKLRINPYFSDKARQFNFPRTVIGGLKCIYRWSTLDFCLDQNTM